MIVAAQGLSESVADKSQFKTKSIKLTELNSAETLSKQLMTNPAERGDRMGQ